MPISSTHALLGWALTAPSNQFPCAGGRVDGTLPLTGGPRMKSKSRIVSVIPPKELVRDSDQKQIKRDQVTATQEFKSVAEKLAKSTVFHKNFYVPELREQFSHYDRMKRIDKVFPYADIDGRGHRTLLFIDEARNQSDVEIFREKAKLLKKLGYLYCYFDLKDLEHERLDQALEQLGRL